MVVKLYVRTLTHVPFFGPDNTQFGILTNLADQLIGNRRCLFRNKETERTRKTLHDRVRLPVRIKVSLTAARRSSLRASPLITTVVIKKGNACRIRRGGKITGSIRRLPRFKERRMVSLGLQLHSRGKQKKQKQLSHDNVIFK